MTFITLQNGKIVLRDGKVGTEQACCCGICPYCSSSCLEVTFSGWSGTAGGCDCVDLNGTYLLTRGSGCQPGVTAVVVDDIGSGAVLEVTLAFDAATGTYYVSGVTVVSAGANYTSDATVTVSVSGGQVFAGDTPIISVTQQREEPDGLSLIVDALALGPGSGETLTPVWQPENTTSGSETWSVASVTVTSGGSGFEEYSPVRFDIQTAAEIESEVVPFDGFAVVDHAEPVVDTISVDTAGGSGATFSLTWEIDSTATDFLLAQYPGSDSRHWRIASLTITNGGSGYAAGDEVSLTLNGRHIDYALGEAAASYLLGTVSVDGSGAITGTSFTAGGGPSLYRTDGIIQSVVIQDDGEYYENSGITGATVENPGTIIAEGSNAPEGSVLGCVYELCETIDCDGTSACRRITLSITDTNRTLAVYVDDVEVLSGEIAAEGNPCGNMSFASGDFAGSSCTAGTASVADATCGTGAAADACCCDEQCCRCCECASGDPPVLNGTATADGIQWSGWNGTEYTTFDVQLSGVCCCCDLLTDVISGLTNGPSPATAENVGALFGGVMPGRDVDTGEPPLGGYVAWGATAPCADYWAFLGVGDPCEGYPDPCVGTWCVDDPECFDCYDGIDGFKPLQSQDPFVETCENPLP